MRLNLDTISDTYIYCFSRAIESNKLYRESYIHANLLQRSKEFLGVFDMTNDEKLPKFPFKANFFLSSNHLHKLLRCVISISW